MIYEISYWLHICSSLVWLGAFLASLLLAFYIGRYKGTKDEAKYIRMERKFTAIGGHFGAIGILISGWVMAVIPGGPQWGWFNIPLYNWLAIKQLLFLLILVMVGFSISKSVSLKKAWREGDGSTISRNVRKKWKGAYTLSLVIHFLVVINTWLGFTKPI